ncbi:PREDICTED: AT-rich interactive domain-containing protein 4B isoform X2 [Dinoponera quadriceps]|uniref:AT-rich interactive domain-containing protein 4B isoform X2 n=1 Tax=Dinoponera quadriceps TaxID=609295 RepID=A0A6P3WYD1_DINQU|nr:PREDICTED: AT-rich interactive domain-containing protein 4B isoform X2 [Dinoponera quadriceps]
MLGDDPPYLSVGTEVSAKYKGAFCEAKIRKVVRSVKCRVTYKQGLGTATVADDQIKGTLRVGASVEARHGDRKEFVEATITKIQDCSQYTVVFDDGDITTLRRTALCLKSGRHFAESETLDQLPLTHPEHFSTPVIGGRRGRRSRDESSEDEDSPPRNARDSGFIGGAKEGMETEPEIGRVVCVELGDKKKKDNWFPGLVVAPTAQDTVRIRVRDDYLVRSFKDARYYTVPKKEATEFTKELVNKVENSTLKVAVEKALLFLEKNELPPHWDRDSLFGHSVSSGNSDSDGELDSDSSDDEPREEKDHFVAQLYKFMDDRGTPINNCPMIGSEDIDLYRLFRAVYKLGGYNRVTNQNQWKAITRRLGFAMQNSPSTHNLVKQAYKKFLHSFEDFYRKLGCTMVNHPRGSTRKQRPGRSLIRDKDRNTPIPPPVPPVKNDKEEDEKKAAEDEKKEKKEVKKDQVKEEEIVKIKKKEEAEGSGSGQESDVNVEAETESSSSSAGEKPPKVAAPVVPALPPSTNASSSRAKPKSSKEETKKKTVEKKKTESKKQEKKDEKPKEEEATKTTRSKAKDDTVKNKSATEGRETRTPSREAEKKTLSKQRRLTDEELKKRGRKRKEYETEKSRADEQLTETTAPSYKGPVDFGDRLKVYYGPTHESKVTYEAKVIDIEKDGAEPMYLVHYTGWNTRYDEWIKASRIAQNFTQTQGRVKRTKTPRPQTPSANLPANNKSAKGTCSSTTNVSQSRRRAQSVAPPTSTSAAVSVTSAKEVKKDEKDKEATPQPIRASTPLSIASSSSRTKSPATPANNRQTRTSRNTELSGTIEHRRRTRRMSGHTDISVVSESEGSDGYDSDTTEPEQAKTRLRGAEERKRKEARNRVEERIKVEDASDAEDEKDNLEEPRKGRRLRRTPGKIQGIKSEPDSDEEQPKGRDFDLNQIRSELKGFDKAVKMELVRMEPDDEMKMDEKENVATIATRVSPKLEKLVETPKVEVVETKVESTEDIYEFKEPEPFEFEVRNKRDTSGEKDKLKKKMFEDEPKSPKKKQKIAPMSTTPAREAKNNDSTDGDGRAKKPRKLFSNKRSDEAASEAPPVVTVVPQSLSKSSAQPAPPSVYEDAFDKLCESPSFNQQLKPAAIVEEPPKVASSGLNLLFSDLPAADDEGTRDDSEDRLIISETEVSEVEQDNSFSYQQEVQFHGAELPDATDSGNKSEPTVAAAVECAREETMTGAGSSANKSIGNNSLDQKQNVVKLPAQSELRLLDTKLLDLAPVAPLPIVTPPAPISARLPATSTIEEKLSAAAMAFRNKAKDNKRDSKATLDEDVTADVTTRKLLKLDITILQRTKDDEMDEQEKKQEEAAMMSEEEQRREIMRVAIKQKEEELQQLKLKKEAELKKFAEAKTIVAAEHKTKLQEVGREDGWKSAENEQGKRPEEEMLEQTEKERIDTRKKPVNPDILDSTDSSDSEQRLVIDNEEPQDVKMSVSSNFDVKLRAELDRLQDTQERYARTQKTSNVQHQLQQQQQECMEVKASSDVVSSVSKTDEEGETMNSLLCEEEIPGSPAPPGSESIEQASADPACNSPKNEVTESSIVLMEMPFASAPTSGQSTTCSSSTVATLSMSLPKTVETSVPVSLPMQQNAPLNVRQQQHQQQHQQQLQQQLQHHHHHQQQQQHQQHMPAVLLPPQRRESNEAAPVMDNTPPTTPDSSISNITGSPREERTGGSSPTSEDNIKLNRDSSEADNDSAGKGPGFSEDDTLPISESNSVDRTPKPPAKRSICDEMHSSPKKRKRSRKHSECGSVVAPKKPAGRQSSSRHGRYVAGSDSDDTSEGSNLCTVNTAPTAHANLASVTDLAATYSSRSPRPTKYNFYVELDPELDASQRIAVLQQKLTELRKTYNAVKVELATIERRRKKLRRREREAVKAAKAEMQQACS